jgi:hypothetical protein
LPSSLTRVLPIPLVCSTRLPVSVCGTGARISLEAFLGSMGLTTYGPMGTAITPQDQATDLPIAIISLQAWHREQPSPGWPTLLRHPIAQTTPRGSGILTGCPSPTPFGLGLGPTNPTRINLPSETLDLRGSCFSHDLRYSCRHSHFCPLHQSSRSGFSANTTLPYCSSQSEEPAASVLDLSPVTFSAQDHLTSELLRTL